MAKYRNVNTGAVVEVRDDKAMDSEWEAQESKKPAPKKSSAKSSDDK